jgi:hypothetical protein
MSLEYQNQLRVLLDQHNLTQAAAAEAIAKVTMRPCSQRTVRAWLASATLPSARPCPEWAVKALAKALSGKAQKSRT